MESFVRNLEDRPKGSIKDFIYVIDESLTKTFCNNVIKKFNDDSRKQDGVVGHQANRVDKNIKNTKDLNISISPGWENEDEIFYSSLTKGLKKYNKYLLDINDGICNAFPNTTFITNDTGYKVQMYEPGGIYHWHHDWSMSIKPVASRIFTFMWYLNTIKEEDEGYTVFADGIKVQPIAGRLIFFPATWTYIHRGYPPKVRKYLCNGWIHSYPPS